MNRLAWWFSIESVCSIDPYHMCQVRWEEGNEQGGNERGGGGKGVRGELHQTFTLVAVGGRRYSCRAAVHPTYFEETRAR